jgi:hypothetical protein
VIDGSGDHESGISGVRFIDEYGLSISGIVAVDRVSIGTVWSSDPTKEGTVGNEYIPLYEETTDVMIDSLDGWIDRVI